MGWFSKLFFGSPEKHKRVSTLTDEQQPLLQQLIDAIQGSGAGGAFGSSADYWRMILDDNPELMDQFMAPEMRKFNEQIIPGLSEQFAGMGSGGLSSSGFRNSAVQAGTDLQERLAAMRANLKNQAASGLLGMGQMGLGNYSQDVMTQAGTQGLIPGLSNAFGQGFGSQLGKMAGDWTGNWAASKFGQSSPYGNKKAG